MSPVCLPVALLVLSCFTEPVRSERRASTVVHVRPEDVATVANEFGAILQVRFTCLLC